MDEKRISCREVAEICGVKLTTVWSWIRTGKLPAYKISKTYWVSPDDLDAFIHTKA